MTEPELRSLDHPSEGVPDVVTTAAGVAQAAQELAAGTGPVAVDAERASGYRYSARAYLIQLRRKGSGTFLIDPIGVRIEEFAPLAEALREPEWILHSADQDLPGLAELGLVPKRIFDTELAGRLCGHERVGLAAMVANTLGFELKKGHGAADWSQRPLPHEWLVYAALDVELLIELRDQIAAELEEQGKTDWAAEEFDYERLKPPPRHNPERWRRTSQIHTLRKPRQLAAVRELWLARDEIARTRDIAPGRILPDAAIIQAAVQDPQSANDLRQLAVFGSPRQRRNTVAWLQALNRARALDEDDLPPVSLPQIGPPPANRWARRNPEAADRLTAARTELMALSEEVKVPLENLVSPELVRRLCWDWSPTTDPAQYIDETFAAGGARQWQRQLTVPRLAAAIG
ncbi:ribonuclease D [Smaragdicoccus niigatensis]|uniref:HRDC domain-containing protein n=1 Tax=Smaragdicoccus niigatensis TaxID=359359 RepID=UPI00037CDD23|nr:ribonuclease D [Smaragdicoccus niigatensis]